MLDPWKALGMSLGFGSSGVLFIVAVRVVLGDQQHRPPVIHELRGLPEAPAVAPARVQPASIIQPTPRVIVDEVGDSSGWDFYPDGVDHSGMTLLPAVMSTRDNLFGQFGVSPGYLERQLPGPLKQHADSFVSHGLTYEINPILLSAIARHETGNGTSSVYRDKHNAMGVSNRDGARSMSSVDESIRYMAQRLTEPDGYYKDCHTIAELGEVYAPAKTRVKNDPTGLNKHWPSAVSRYFNQMQPTLSSN